MAASQPDAGTPLSEREQQIAWLYVEGRSHKEIARSLDIAPSTVRTHLNTVYRKLKVTNRIELLRRFSGSLPTLADLRHAPAHPARSLAVDCDTPADPAPGMGLEGRPGEMALIGRSLVAVAQGIGDAVVPPRAGRGPETVDVEVLGCRLRLIQAIVDGRLDAVSAPAEFRRLIGALDNGRAETARTQFVTVDGHRIAYRSVGENSSRGVPIVFLNRFRASMDDWDPALVNAVARDRRVILFDAIGVGESDGQTPASLERAADDAIGFVRALGLTTVDMLGWSLGGMTAQIIAAKRPDLVHRLALIATLPPGGSRDIVVTGRKWERVATQPAFTEEDLLYLFFSPSPEGVAAGRASLERTSLRRDACEIKTRTATMRAQYQAATSFFRNGGNWYERIKSIRAPTLVANGDNDPVFPAIDSVVLARAIPQGQLALYPDSGHGFQFQYPHRFAADLNAFLRH